MSLWFDTSVSQQSSLLNPGNGPTPASQGVEVLQEFLATDQFLSKVGANSGALASEFTKPGGSLNLDAIDGVLAKAFTETTVGPQVVDVTMSATNPSYLQGTLTAVSNEFVAEVSSALTNRGTDSASYYRPAVKAALTTFDTDNATYLAYAKAHPRATPATDPYYAELVQEVAAAQTTYNNDNGNLEQAELADQPDLSTTSFHIVDSPSPPVALSSKKHDILIGVAGLMAGIVISLIALSALTGLDKTARSEEDIDSVLDVDVVASIGQLRDRRSLTFRRERSS